MDSFLDLEIDQWESDWSVGLDLEVLEVLSQILEILENSWKFLEILENSTGILGVPPQIKSWGNQMAWFAKSWGSSAGLHLTAFFVLFHPFFVGMGLKFVMHGKNWSGWMSCSWSKTKLLF